MITSYRFSNTSDIDMENPLLFVPGTLKGCRSEEGCEDDSSVTECSLWSPVRQLDLLFDHGITRISIGLARMEPLQGRMTF